MLARGLLGGGLLLTGGLLLAGGSLLGSCSLLLYGCLLCGGLVGFGFAFKFFLCALEIVESQQSLVAVIRQEQTHTLQF